jgi:hypothetical protein
MGDNMSDNILSSDQVFSATERRVIALIVEATIGPDELRNLPGASDPLILAIILEKAEHFAARLKAGIDLLQAELDPLALPAPDLLQKLDSDVRFRSLSRILTIIVMQSYYQDPRVLEASGLSTRPPFPLGHEVESGDWSLLDPVKQRDPFYRPS